MQRSAEKISRLRAADEQLRPGHAQVFRVLREAATERPGEYVTMRELAERGWNPDRRPRDVLQIKNNVQRAIYEIRMKLGRDLILNEGSTYRLNEQYLETALTPEGRVASEPVLIPESFDSQIRNLLREAKDTRDLRSLVIWGTRAALTLRESSDEMLEAALAGRNIRLVCSEGQIAVDIVAQMMWKHSEPPEAFCRRLCSWIEFDVMANQPGTGAAWLSLREADSRLHMALDSGKMEILATGPGVEAYLGPLEKRIDQVRASTLPYKPLILVDKFDRTLDGLSEKLWQYFETMSDDPLKMDVRVLISRPNPPVDGPETA